MMMRRLMRECLPVSFSHARSIIVERDHIAFAEDNGDVEIGPDKASLFIVR